MDPMPDAAQIEHPILRAIAVAITYVLQEIDANIVYMGDDDCHDDGPPMNPDPGQTMPDGSPITIQAWFLDRGFPAPTGPDGSDIPGDFIWRDVGDGNWVWGPAA